MNTLYAPVSRPYFIALDLLPGDEEELETIIDGLRTTRSEDPEFLDRFSIIGPLSVHELGAEIFALGASYEYLEEEEEVVMPFDFVILTEKPTSVEELDLLFEAKLAVTLGRSS